MARERPLGSAVPRGVVDTNKGTVGVASQSVEEQVRTLREQVNALSAAISELSISSGRAIASTARDTGRRAGDMAREHPAWTTLVLIGLVGLIVASTAGPYRYMRRPSRTKDVFAEIEDRDLQLRLETARSQFLASFTVLLCLPDSGKFKQILRRHGAELILHGHNHEQTVLEFPTATGPAIIVGTPWLEDGKLYNAVALLEGGRIAGLRFKVDLPNYGVFDEKRVFAVGPMPGPVNFRGVRIGIGDDAAVVEPERNRVEVLTVDSLVEGIHFDRAFVPPEAVGYRALAVSLSDIAAMAAKPVASLVAATLPPDFGEPSANALFDAMRERMLTTDLSCEDFLKGPFLSFVQELVGSRRVLIARLLIAEGHKHP